VEGERTVAPTVAENKRVYKRHTERPNAQGFEALPEVVAPGRYREICVNFTPGWVDLPEEITSLEKVAVGIPGLHVRIEDVAAPPFYRTDVFSGMRDRPQSALSTRGRPRGPHHRL
jgi:hypothetical protein